MSTMPMSERHTFVGHDAGQRLVWQLQTHRWLHLCRMCLCVCIWLHWCICICICLCLCTSLCRAECERQAEHETGR